TAATLEAGDIQGLVAAGYGHLTAACFLVLGIGDADGGGNAAARGWLRELADAVTAADRRSGDRAVNIAFTHRGLLALGLGDDVAATFSNEFVSGMAVPHRCRVLGDVGDSAPERWQWGGPA